MKKTALLKRLLALTLALIMCLSFMASCRSASSDNKDDSTSTADTTKDPNTNATPEYDGDFAKPTDSDEKLSEGDYVKVTEVDAKYAKQSGQLMLISATAPQMSIGGIEHPSENNNEYYRLDASKMFTLGIDRDCRSMMNVTFRCENEELDAEFVKGAEAAGLTSLKGHRAVGGMRASIYNAMPREGILALIDYIDKFEANH